MLEVGEYVRTKNGQIVKLENNEEFYEDSVDIGIGIMPEVDAIWIDKEYVEYIEKKDIVNHSKNIIDLIEEGDYVNGYKVIEVHKKSLCGTWAKIDSNKVEAKCRLWDIHICSVVTKEAFEQMEYKV